MRKNTVKLLCGLLLLTAGLVSGSFAQDKPDDVIRVDTNLVTVPVIVSDRDNRYISGLKQSDFSVYKDGEKQSIEYFASDEAPINVALLLDTSRSTEPVLGKIKKAAQEFLKQLRPSDRAMVVTFDSDVATLAPLTGDRERLRGAVKEAEIGERFGTVLNDAVYDAVSTGLSGFKGRKAVILLTDGKDAGSLTTRDQLIYRLREADVLVYPIFYDTGELNRRPQVFGGGFPRGGVFGGGMGRRGGGARDERRRRRVERSNERAVEFLQALADATAGRLFEKEMADIDDAFSTIAGELRNQYVIGFYPENIEPGREYRLKVTVTRTNSVVRAKGTFRIREP